MMNELCLLLLLDNGSLDLMMHHPHQIDMIESFNVQEDHTQSTNDHLFNIRIGMNGHYTF